MPWESLILGVMKQYFLVIPHIVRHTKCSTKKPLCVEESVHVLFDESNSLSENDVQDEDFELGLTKKDCLPNQEKGKNPQEGSGTGPDSKIERQVSEQTRRTSVKPCLEQKITNNLETATKIGTETGRGSVSELGLGTVSEPR